MIDAVKLFWILLIVPLGLSLLYFLRLDSERLKPIDKVLAGSGAVVALTTAALPYFGYGTILYADIVLFAWGIVAQLSSGQFADQHHSAIWPVALVLNMLGFSIVAIPVWAICRNRRPRAGSIAIVCWLVLYVAMLFFLFPATDGP
jgi:hypothetical protein